LDYPICQPAAEIERAPSVYGHPRRNITLTIFTAIHKLYQRRSKKYRYEVIKLTPKEKAALGTLIGSMTAIILVTGILMITSM
jgi:hypothetical protein